MPTRTEWQSIGGDFQSTTTTGSTAAYYQTVPTPVSEDTAHISRDDPAPTEVASHQRGVWDSYRSVLSNTPTRNCNPREEGSDTTIDPTFNSRMDEMLLASHVDIKDLWRKK